MKRTNKSSAVAGMGDRSATIDMGRKVGAAVPLSMRESWVPISQNVVLTEGYLHTKWHPNPPSRLVTVHQCHRQVRLYREFNFYTSAINLSIVSPIISASF